MNIVPKWLTAYKYLVFAVGIAAIAAVMYMAL